jgi:hypothetical protein
MDVAEAIARRASEAVDDKRLIVSEALRSTAGVADEGEAIRGLVLLSGRLSGPAYESVRAEFEDRVAEVGESLTVRNPELSIAVVDRTPDLVTVNPGSALAKGIVLGLSHVGGTAPSRLAALAHYPSAAVALLSVQPSIAVQYLQGTSEDLLSRAELSHWVGRLAPSHRAAVRRELVGNAIKSSEDAGLLSEILRGVDRSEVSDLLGNLHSSTKGFRDPVLRRVVAEQLSRVYRDEVRIWGTEAPEWSNGAADVLAATCESNDKGCSEVAGLRLSPDRKAMVIAHFLQAVAPTQYPIWLKDYFSRDVSLVADMLLTQPDSGKDVASQIAKFVEEAPDAPLARADALLTVVGKLSDQPYFSKLQDVLMRSAVEGVLSSSLNSDVYGSWIAQPFAVEWYRTVKPWSLRSTLQKSGLRTPETWSRAWSWVAETPTVLYQRTPSVVWELIDTLLASELRVRFDDFGHCWIRILRRNTLEAPQDNCITVSVQALAFAFSNRGRALSELVLESFPTVYLAVTSGSDTERLTAPLFRAYEWDRGKELRNSLVEFYYDSDAPPGDLAIVAERVRILGKIFRRVKRRWHGTSYVESMLADLTSRPHSPEVDSVAKRLVEMIRDPSYYEPWD